MSTSGHADGEPEAGEYLLAGDREVPAHGPPVGPLLDVRNLRVEFDTDDGVVEAVTDVSFTVGENEVLGIVGESGSGKTVTSLALLGLLPNTARVTGDVRFRGRAILGLPERELREIRGSEIAMVFQDALAALNPVYKVGEQIAEVIRAHQRVKWSDRAVRGLVVHLLDLVGIPRPAERAEQYPHEYSGGMRQRAMIAMAIANEPALLIADEPTTSLDVTIQAQVLEVLERIQNRTNSSIVLITHDMGVVAGMADRMMVMYAGHQVESGSVDDVFYRSRHPYTLGLLASLPRIDEDAGLPLHRIEGQPPSLLDVPAGCPFHPRCPQARVPEPCVTDKPALRPVDGNAHVAACHFAEELRELSRIDLRAQDVGIPP